MEIFLEYFNNYQTTILAIGSVGLLMFIQLIVVDVVGILKKHVPGFPVENNHDSFLFRANRAYLNSNESVAIFILFVGFALLSSADPSVVNASAITYLCARLAHMFFYYLNSKVARSAAFGVSAISLLALFISGMLSWF